MFYFLILIYIAVKIVVSEKGNLLKPDEPKKWYASAKSTGEISIKSLGKDITQRCTMNHADTLAVLEALTQVLTERLDEGMIVRFGDFGSFQVVVGSAGAESQDKFSTSMIKTRKVVFRPGADIKTMLNNLKFER